MIKSKTGRSYEQELVNKFFNSESTHWAKIYKQNDLYGFIHQQRLTVALNFINELSLPKTTHILDIGCGTGFISAVLAQKGFTVEAIDSAPAMIELTQQYTKKMGLGHNVHATLGNAHELNFEDQSFDLIVALGVTPFLYNLKKALNEITRVLVHGGYIVLNADNRYRLNRLLDPLFTPAFEPIREKIRHELKRTSLQGFRKEQTLPWHTYSIKEFNEYLHEVNLVNLKNTNIGFGPFTFFAHHLFSDQIGLKIHQKLQQYANQGFPLLRSTGSQYLVLARKG